MDPYSYVRNNPVNFNDPTGHVLKDDDIGGLDPLSPTWYVDNYGDSAATINRIDIWYDTHQDYNLYSDVNVWATNHGEITAKWEYAQIVQSYCTWRAINGQQDVLGQQMKDQAKAFISGQFFPTVHYYESENEYVSSGTSGNNYMVGGATVIPLGRGSTGRTVARTAAEAKAMEEILEDPYGGRQMGNLRSLGDPRWPGDEGWIKLYKKIDGVEIHYLYSPVLGEFDDFKFAKP